MSDFETQTNTLRRWVQHEGVATDALSVELLAWSAFITHGMHLTTQAGILRRAADLLDEIATSP
jgi:hypothetical protein